MEQPKSNSVDGIDKNETNKERGRRRFGENGFEEQGGYMNAKKAKLDQQFHQNKTVQGSAIFSGVSVYINGYVDPPEPQLREMFILHGGSFHPYLSAKTTFVIATNLSNTSKNSYGTKALKPQWITDSITVGQKLDHRKYMLYNFNEEQNQYTLSQMIEKQKASYSSNGEISSTHLDLNGRIDAPTVNKVNRLGDAQSVDTAEITNNHIAAQCNQNLNAEIISNGNSLEIKNRIGDSESVTSLTTLSASSTGLSLTARKKVKMATEEGFLEDFFSHSRLHLISSHKKDMQIMIGELRKNIARHKFPNLEVFKNQIRESKSKLSDFDIMSNSVLMHIDLDCFFVSVGLLSRPHMRNKPVIVTHSTGKGEMNSKSDIACASYEARKFGVKNGMWVTQARELCPSVEVIPYDFEEYKTISKLFFETVASVTLDIEPGSVDEMIVNISSVLQTVPDSTPEDLAQFIRKIIFDATKCPASIGIGSNRVLAKLAARKAKPDGFFHLEDNTALNYIAELPVADLPGVGYSNNSKLKDLFSVKTCKDLLKVPVKDLKAKFGEKTVERMLNLCRGIDTSELKYGFDRPKSISVDVNYGIRFHQDKELNDFIVKLCKELASRGEKSQATATALQLKLLTRRKGAGESIKHGGHGIVDSITRSGHFMQATRNWQEIYRVVMNLLRMVSVPVSDYRGIGMSLTGLQFDFDRFEKRSRQTTLFAMSRGMEMLQKSHKMKAPKLNQSSTSITSEALNCSSPTINIESSLLLNNPVVVEEESPSETINVQINHTSLATNVVSASPCNEEIHDIESDLHLGEGNSGALDLLIEKLTENEAEPNLNLLEPLIASESTSNVPESTFYAPVLTLYADESTTNAHGPTSNEWSNPEKVDINVLRELPKDIAKELAHHYGIDTAQIDDYDVHSTPPLRLLDRVDHDIADSEDTESGHANGGIDNDTSNAYAQANAEMNPYHNIECLDPNFLSALPASIRNEVVIQFQQAKASQRTYQSVDNEPQPCSSRQAIERDLQFQTANIDPIGFCESVYDDPISVEKSCVAEVLGSSNSENFQSDPVIMTETEESEDLEVETIEISSDSVNKKTDWDAFWTLNSLTEPLLKGTPVVVPALCDLTDISEVRNRIREGIKHLHEPSVEEIHNLELYFNELILQGWLSQTYVLIKFLNRKLQELEPSSKWTEVLKKIIKNVQRRCKKKYQGIMPLD